MSSTTKPFEEKMNASVNHLVQRPANDGQDWYFMAYGHDYKQALKD